MHTHTYTCWSPTVCHYRFSLCLKQFSFLHTKLISFSQWHILFLLECFRQSCTWVFGCWYFDWALWSIYYPSCPWDKGYCWIWGSFLAIQHWAWGGCSKKLGFCFLHHFAVCCIFGCVCILFIRLCHLVYVLQLSVERLSSMKKYVFGLGSAQVMAKLHCLSI